MTYGETMRVRVDAMTPHEVGASVDYEIASGDLYDGLDFDNALDWGFTPEETGVFTFEYTFTVSNDGAESSIYRLAMTVNVTSAQV